MCYRPPVRLAVHNADMTSRRLTEEHPCRLNGQRLCRREVRPFGIRSTRTADCAWKYPMATWKIPRRARRIS